MIKLRTNQKFKFGQINNLPIIGETQISEDGIIEVEDQEAADFLKKCHIGFYDLNDPIFSNDSNLPVEKENEKTEEVGSDLKSDYDLLKLKYDDLILKYESLSNGKKTEEVVADSNAIDSSVNDELLAKIKELEETVISLKAENDDLSKQLTVSNNNLKLAKLKNKESK